MLNTELETKDLNSNINSPFNMKINKLDIPTIIQKYQNGLPTTDLGKEYGVSSVAIWGLLKRKNVKLRDSSHAQRKYTLNETYFENINTEKKAYWLGFLWADGYLNNKALSLILSIKDKNHLSKFLNSLETDRPLKEYRYSYQEIAKVHIPNKKIVNDLNKLQYHNKKIIPKISPSLYNHFLRGLFDGDGCIRLTKNNDSYFSLLAEKELLEWIQKNIFMSIGINPETKLKKRHKESKSNVLAIELGGRDNAKKIYGYLYNDATIFLERKKQMFEDIEKARPQERRCSVVGCDIKHFALGLCNKHHYQEYGSIKRKERYQKYGE